MVPLAGAAGAIALAVLALRTVPADVTPVAATASVAPPAAPAPARQDLELPLDPVERITPLGGEAACVLGGRRVACTEDAGETWLPLSELPDHVLAVARVQGETLAAAADGAIYALRPGEPAALRAMAPPGLSVVDAVAREGELYLLAHRYDAPTDILRLPRVEQTVLLVLGADGRLTERGHVDGYGGERLMAQGEEIATFGLYDAQAYRSRDGGRTFRRVPARERLAADLGGLLATVERRSQKLDGGGGAHPMSSLVVSADDGASWTTAFEAPGELTVNFRDATQGVVIARDDAVAFVTTDGARTFRMAVRDERLMDVADVAPVGAGWIAVTADGHGVRITVPR
jgi:hypothetical protein